MSDVYRSLGGFEGPPLEQGVQRTELIDPKQGIPEGMENLLERGPHYKFKGTPDTGPTQEDLDHMLENPTDQVMQDWEKLFGIPPNANWKKLEDMGEDIEEFRKFLEEGGGLNPEEIPAWLRMHKYPKDEPWAEGYPGS